MSHFFTANGDIKLMGGTADDSDVGESQHTITFNLAGELDGRVYVIETISKGIRIHEV